MRPETEDKKPTRSRPYWRSCALLFGLLIGILLLIGTFVVQDRDPFLERYESINVGMRKAEVDALLREYPSNVVFRPDDFHEGKLWTQQDREITVWLDEGGRIFSKDLDPGDQSFLARAKRWANRISQY